MHEYFIFYASRRICGKLYLFIRAESIDRLDKSDRTHGNQVLQTDVRALKTFRYVYDKAKIVFDQCLFRVLVVRQAAYHVAFLFGGKRSRQ